MKFHINNTELTSFHIARTWRPHIVILGAGASIAACPNGDANEKRLPVMNNLVEVLEIKDLIVKAGYDPTLGFENLYSQIHSTDPQSLLVKEIEKRVEDYFNQLVLPNYPTIYDLLLLSLRQKDAIFTFNWDPFLADAYDRIEDIISDSHMPNIFHLHGNVRVSYCQNCDLSQPKAEACSKCGESLTPTRLLYPVEQKNYTDDPYLSRQWSLFHDYIKRALVITFFGYSAPTTDMNAMDIFTKAWKGGNQFKPLERLEIIDIRDEEELSSQWDSFSFNGHINYRNSFYNSFLAQYPRRSCEAWFQTGWYGKSVDSTVWTDNPKDIMSIINELITFED